MYACEGKRSTQVLFLCCLPHVERQTPIDLELSDSARLTDSSDLPIVIFPAVALQLQATTHGFFTWLLGMKLGS